MTASIPPLLAVAKTFSRSLVSHTSGKRTSTANARAAASSSLRERLTLGLVAAATSRETNLRDVRSCLCVDKLESNKHRENDYRSVKICFRDFLPTGKMINLIESPDPLAPAHLEESSGRFASLS
jgi:hypothetical protein